MHVTEASESLGIEWRLTKLHLNWRCCEDHISSHTAVRFEYSFVRTNLCNRGQDYLAAILAKLIDMF